MGANFLKVLMTCDKNSTDHLVTWCRHFTSIFRK